MPLRKRIFFSFLAMIMIGFAQMISSVSGVGKLSDISDALGKAHVAAQRVTALAELNSRLQLLQQDYLNTVARGRPDEALLKEHNQAAEDMKKLAEEIQKSAAQGDPVRETLARLANTVKDYQSAFDDVQNGLSALVNRKMVFSKALAALRSIDDKPENALQLADTQSQWFQMSSGVTLDALRPENSAELTAAVRGAIAKLQQQTSEGGDLGAGVRQLSSLFDLYVQALLTLGQEQSGPVANLNKQSAQLRYQTTALIDYAKDSLKRNTQLLESQVSSQKFTAVGVGVVCMAIGVLLAFFLTREIIKPIEDFRAAADRVSRGDPNVTLPEPTGEDELAELSRSFQRMLNSLKALMSQDEDEEEE